MEALARERSEILLVRASASRRGLEAFGESWLVGELTDVRT
jgi:hypothetical protein